MPKRKKKSKQERWERKRKKYDEKLANANKKRSRRIIYSTDEEDPEQGHPEKSLVKNTRTLEGHALNAVPTHDVDEISRPLLPPSPPPPAISDPIVSDPGTSAPAETTNVTHADAAMCEEPASNDHTSSEDNLNEPAMDFDPELLKALGEFEGESVDWGDDLHEDIAKRFQQILLVGLKKEAKEELSKKYLLPKNVQYAKAPTLNPEISAMLTEACRNRDKRILTKQDQLGKALTAVGTAMTELLKKNPDIPGIIKIMNDAGRLLADSHFTETDTRRALIIPLVDKSLIEPFKDRKRDSSLFGEKLGELVKNSQGIKRAGQYIQATQASSSGASLNWKGPSSRFRPYRGNQTRGGGQRYQYPNRRRAPPPPPPPPSARRQPAQAAARRAAPAPAARPPPPECPPPA